MEPLLPGFFIVSEFIIICVFKIQLQVQEAGQIGAHTGRGGFYVGHGLVEGLLV